MSLLEIRSHDNRTQFRPGETLEGSVNWLLDKSAEALELRLIWFTRGKGDTDVSVEQTRRFEAPHLSGDDAFRFVLPEAPYSFSGKLISLVWALELVVIPGEDATQWEFSLSPTGQEVRLPDGEGLNPQTGAWLKKQKAVQKSTLAQTSPFETT